MKIKPLLFDDWDWLRQLRNTNRKSFFNPKPISKPEHWAWAMNIDHAKFWPFVIWHSRQRAGFFSVKEIEYGVYEIGNLMISKEFRGKGLMGKAIAEYLKVGCCSDDPNTYLAFVKPNNQASIRTFEKLGFTRWPVGSILMFVDRS